MIRALLALCLALSCWGCANDAVQLEEGEQSLAEIKRAIVSVMGDPRAVSQNQREFTSQYFSRKADANFNPIKSKERAYAIFSILGTRRPYNIEIHVLVERRSGRIYVESGEDTPSAQKLVLELKNRLNQSREGRNLIDDFRAF